VSHEVFPPRPAARNRSSVPIRSQALAPLQGRTTGPASVPNSETSFPASWVLRLFACSVARRPPGGEQRLPSWGWLPLQRMSSREVRLRGLSSPATFRLQGSSPSCRFTPSRAVWVCFIPQTPMGFFPSRLSPLDRGEPLIAGPFPSCRYRPLPKLGAAAFRGLLSIEGPFTSPGLLGPQTADALLGFHPLQSSTFPAMGSASRPLPSCARQPVPPLGLRVA